MANNISLGIVIGAALSGTVGRAFQSLDAKAVGLGKSLHNVRLGRAASDDVMQYRTKLANLTAAQHQFGSSNTNLVGQIARTELALGKASEKARKYGIDVGSIVGENRKLMQSEQSLARQLERTNALKANRDKRGELGSKVASTVGMAFAASAPIKSAIEFESKMADIRKVSDKTDEELKILGKTILDSSVVMPMSPIGIGSIVEAGYQAGIAENEIMAFKDSSIKMGVAFGIGGEEAGQTMVSWRAGMALTQKQAEGLADAINYLDANVQGAAKAKDISEVVRRGGAHAKASGLSEIDTAALSAAFLNPGTAPEIAGTGMKNLLNAMTAGAADPKLAAMPFFEGFKKTAGEVAEGMQKDAKGTIMEVLEGLSKIDPVKLPAMVGDLFGQEGILAIAPLLVNLDATRQAFGLVADAGKYAGSMQKEYDIRSKTTANSLVLLGNQTTRLATNVGTILLPTLNVVVGALGDGINVVTGLAEEFPLVTKVVVGAAVGLVGLKVAALGASYAATIIKDGWLVATRIVDFFRLSTLRTNAALVWQKAVLIGTAIQQKSLAVWTGVVTTAQWLWNAAIVANPIGAMVAVAVVAVAALGAAVYYIYNNWGGITTWFSGVFTDIGGVVTTVGSAIGAAFFTAASSVRAVWEPVINWLAEKFTWIGQSVEWIKGIGSSIGGAVSSAASNISQQAKGTVLGAAMASTVAAPALATPLPTMPPVASSSPQAAGAGMQHPATQNNVFHITQQPGEDSNALAERVAKHLKRQQAADARGAMHD